MSDPGAHPDGNAAANGPGRSAAETDRDGARARPPSATRRHLIVLAIALVGFVVGVTLVVTGRASTERPSSTTSVATAPRGPLLPDLGAVADQRAATALVAELDPRTLRPEGGASTGSSTSPSSVPDGLDLTSNGLQRCQGAIAQQNPDRSLGERLAAARLTVDDKATFVVSYGLPASGKAAAGTRVVIVDARTCRVVGAVDH